MEGFSIEDAPEFELWVEGERTKWRSFGELARGSLGLKPRKV